MKIPLVVLLGLAATGLAAVQAPPLGDLAPTSKPGLALTFATADGKTDTRGARLVALFVPAGRPPTPFLAAGAFTAKWEGEIQSPLRAEYLFSAETSGDFSLSINGTSVLDAATAKAGKKFQLSKGANKLVAELKSPAQGDAYVRLQWSSRDFATEPVPPTVFTHDSSAKDLRAGERIREGRLLFAQMRCGSCHASETLLPAKGQGMPELAQDAPIFGEFGAKYNEAWLAHWISDPHGTRPKSLMPKVFASKPGEAGQEAADLAAYFSTLGVRNEKPIDEALAPEGGALFANLGCIACHSKPDADGADDHHRVPLAHVKAKWQPAALESWLKNPSETYQWNRMPHFRLNEQEAKQLTAYLITNAKREFPPPPKGDAAKGGAYLVSGGCVTCHAGAPAMNTPRLEATLAGDWSKGCMAPDEAARGRAPDFALTAAQRGALLAFASTGFESLKVDVDAELAERQIKNLNCTACHTLDSTASTWSKLDDEMAPLQAAMPHEEGEGKPVFSSALPPLTWLGEKLKPDWMASFIAGHSGEKPRPWLIPRMPGFTATLAEPLARGLAQQHGLPLAESSPAPNPDFVSAGEVLLGENGGFNCTSCHSLGEKAATAVFEAPGINLGLSGHRMRHGFYSRWVLNPLRLDPDTKMPRFSDDDGKTPLTDHFDGKAAEQFEAIWQYLQSLQK